MKEDDFNFEGWLEKEDKPEKKDCSKIKKPAKKEWCEYCVKYPESDKCSKKPEKKDCSKIKRAGKKDWCLFCEKYPESEKC
jgi:hypothetical protein